MRIIDSKFSEETFYVEDGIIEFKNNCLENSIKKYNTQGLKASIGNCFGFIALMGFPLIVSFALLKKITTSKQHDVVIVQPNVDPYQKFESSSVAGQIDHLIELSKSKLYTIMTLELEQKLLLRC